MAIRASIAFVNCVEVTLRLRIRVDASSKVNPVKSSPAISATDAGNHPGRPPGTPPRGK